MLSADAVAEALRAEVSTAEITNGIRFYVSRGECSAKFDAYKDHVNWVSLLSPGGKGWTKTVHDMAREVFPEYGIKHLTAAAGSAEAGEILKAHGNWKPDPAREGRLRWDVS